MTTSRQVVYFTAPREVVVRTEPLPPPGAGQVLVRTLVSAVSAGTEMLAYRGEMPVNVPLDETIAGMSQPFHYPTPYGYAAVGEVIAVGAGVDADWSGRRVFAFVPHQSHFVAAPRELVAVPADLSPHDAAFLPFVETAVSLVMDGQPVIGERVAVWGQGVIGLLTTAILSRFPLAALVAIDPLPLRRARALALGAHAAFSPDAAVDLAAALGPDGADLGYELSGSPAALNQAITAVGFGARLVVGSWYGQKPVSLALGGAFHRRHLRLISSQVSHLAPRWLARWSKERRLAVAWEFLSELRPAASLITHRFSWCDAPLAYQLLDQNPDAVLQLVFDASFQSHLKNSSQED
ncbi:MAG: zinc-binding alcohol dehydrogenase [Ardenticatenales bacterium]|nr:zinc-binding alcohol dehydrogenase [Ardenticatenales bacterium]